MSGAAWTPGPWSYTDASKSAAMKFAPTCVIKASDVQIASFSWNDNSPWFPTKEACQANARLIAAAPDLYRALEALIELVDAGGGLDLPEIAFGRSSLAKARGES